MVADVRCVEFDGTGSGASSVGLLLGYLERRVVDGRWCFYLRLWGVPESTVAKHFDELTRAAIKAIRQSVAECLVRPPTEAVKPTQLLLWFGVETDRVVSKCRVKPVDQWSFSAGHWWKSPIAAEQEDEPKR
jgi:hypothetical protein